MRCLCLIVLLKLRAAALSLSLSPTISAAAELQVSRRHVGQVTGVSVSSETLQQEKRRK